MDLFGRLSLIGSVITICGFLFWLVLGAPKLAGFLGRLFKKESVYYIYGITVTRYFGVYPERVKNDECFS